MKIKIIRTYHDTYTSGSLTLFDEEVFLFSALTLELPYIDNQRRISCIPEGEYSAFKRFSPRFQITTFEIRQVPNRSAILFHPGNTVKDTEGCILVGSHLTRNFLSRSKVAFNQLMKHLINHRNISVEITSEE